MTAVLCTTSLKRAQNQHTHSWPEQPEPKHNNGWMLTKGWENMNERNRVGYKRIHKITFLRCHTHNNYCIPLQCSTSCSCMDAGCRRQLCI